MLVRAQKLRETRASFGPGIDPPRTPALDSSAPRPAAMACSCCKDDKIRRCCEAFAAVMPWWALLGMLLVVTAFAMLGRGVLG